MSRLIRPIQILVGVFALSICPLAQSASPTPPEDIEKITSEEIRLSVSAFDRAGKFVSDVQKEDLVIIEDGRLHQPSSVRRMPANVLILLDVGNEISYAKRNRITSAVAKELVRNLESDDTVAAMQYGDKVQTICDWTKDRARLNDVLDAKHLGFGRRNVFYLALESAVKFFENAPNGNRHIVLIGDGVDSFNKDGTKEIVSRKLFASDIGLHVISYTQLQSSAIKPRTKRRVEGEEFPKRLPEEVVIALPDDDGRREELITRRELARMPRLGGISLDREMIRRRKADMEKLKRSEEFLATASANTSGEFFASESVSEMITHARLVSRSIDSRYVVNYVPKRALADSPENEVRVVEVTSRRAGLQVRGSRKLTVMKTH